MPIARGRGARPTQYTKRPPSKRKISGSVSFGFSCVARAVPPRSPSRSSADVDWTMVGTVRGVIAGAERMRTGAGIGSRPGRALALAGLAAMTLIGAACSPSRDETSRDETARDDTSSEPELTEIESERMEQLLALGYLDGVREAPEQIGVTRYERDAVDPGLNLAVSGHGPEAVLFDMDGRVLHRWRKAFQEVWPGSRKRTWFRSERYWRRAHLYPNGDLLAIFDSLGMIKLDRDSRLLWRFDEAAHHDLQVADDGTIYVLSSKHHASPLVDQDGEKEPIHEDYVTVLDPDGRILRQVSLLEAVAASDYAHWIDELPRRKGDIFHTNTLEILDRHVPGQPEAFQPGRALVSIHSLHAIAVVDLDLGRVVWGLRGDFRYQHQPTVLEDGRILLFDNLGTPKRSSVVEIDPSSGEVTWRYQLGEPDAFFSFCCGSAERLPNGHTLITETEKGRAFELDPAGRIVWEYWSPYRVPNPDAPDAPKIAHLFEVVRLPADFPTTWIDDATAPDAGLPGTE